MQVPSWQRAASFASRCHQGQMRRDRKTPYIAHPFRVAMTVRDVFGCDDHVALCCALLHDTIEDTATDYDDINRRFGQDIADCVAAMTKNMLLPEDQREPEYDARLASAPWQARLVKLADVYDNGHDMTKTMRPARHIERCERVLRLTEGDTGRPCFCTARAEVETLLRMLRSRDGGR
ncbi:MAG: HD domain-containing protein [Planctomycetota bacterium]